MSNEFTSMTATASRPLHRARKGERSCGPATAAPRLPGAGGAQVSIHTSQPCRQWFEAPLAQLNSMVKRLEQSSRTCRSALRRLGATDINGEIRLERSALPKSASTIAIVACHPMFSVGLCARTTLFRGMR